MPVDDVVDERGGHRARWSDTAAVRCIYAIANGIRWSPYWKPRDLAALLDVGLARVHQVIEDGELEHRRIGECAIRIPACVVAGLRGEEAPVVSPTTERPAADLTECMDRFFERTGRRPEEFVAAWREGRIADTADNARDAIQALALTSVPVSRFGT